MTRFKKLSLSLDLETFERLRALRSLAGVSNNTEIVRRALAWRLVCLKHEESGGKIYWEGSDGESERVVTR